MPNSQASRQPNWLRDFVTKLDDKSDIELRQLHNTLIAMQRSVFKELCERLELLTDKELQKEKDRESDSPRIQRKNKN